MQGYKLKSGLDKEFLHFAEKWIYWYNVKRLHFGKGMDGRPPLEKVRESGYNLAKKFALLPPIILDDVSTFWAVRGGNDPLAPYNSLRQIGCLKRI